MVRWGDVGDEAAVKLQMTAKSVKAHVRRNAGDVICRPRELVWAMKFSVTR